MARERGDLSIRGTLTEAIGLYRRHWRLLIPVAVAILLPQAVAGTFVGELEVERVESVGDVFRLALIPVTLLVNLAGEALLAGVVTAIVLQWRAGHGLPRAREFARTLPWWRLIAIDLLLALGGAAGLVLLIVPGLIFLTYFAITPALIEIEHCRVTESLRRAATLVRGHFFGVFTLIVGAILITEGVAELLSFALHGFVPELAAEVAVDALLESIQALIIALAAITLIELHGDRVPAPLYTPA